MRKLTAGLAITLDGVVDAPSGNWMRFDDEMNEIISAGIAQADAVLLGRRTYLEFAEMWPRLGADVPMAAFMNDTPKYVLSTTLDSVSWHNSTLIRGDLTEVVTELKSRPGRNIQVPGSPRLVWALLRAGLLDELALMVHPVVLGTGSRLFEALPSPLPLVLTGSRTLTSGVVSLTYGPA
jgi:dihydrofolate reductase